MKPYRRRGLNVIDRLPPDERALVIDALHRMDPEDAGEVITDLGKRNDPAALIASLRRARDEAMDLADEAEVTGNIVEELASSTPAVIDRSADVGGGELYIRKPVNQEPGIQGTLGEGRHQAEVARGPVRKMSEILSPEVLRDAMDELLAGRISLSDFVARLPREGATQWKLPAAGGGHRIIDHVLLEGTQVVFRESKNYKDIFEFSAKTWEQLRKDLKYLDRFDDLRIEWRISAKSLEASTLRELEGLATDFPGRFRYILD
jgi:hypothetical protein